VTQHTRKSSKQKQRNPGPLLLVIAGVILVILTAFFALRRPSSASFTPDVKGAPGIKADKEKVDLGDMKLGSTADVSFTITNIGDQPLRFTKQPYVEVKEGC
jgi:hypothetical protein